MTGHGAGVLIRAIGPTAGPRLASGLSFALSSITFADAPDRSTGLPWSVTYSASPSGFATSS